MKYRILSLLAVLSFVVSSCDKIEGEYRENADEIISTVTVFDFTGITCVNCPDAHEELEHLKEVYGDKLQTVAVHGDQNFAGPLIVDGKPWFLYNQIGQKLTDQTKVVGLPQGSINSLQENDFSAFTNWSTAIAAVGYKAPDATLNVEFSVEDTLAIVDVTGSFDENLSKNYSDLHIAVYLLESDINGPQYNLDGVIDPYEHNHVLRASFNNGEISEPLVSIASAGMKIEKSFSLKLDEIWNAENLEAVVFIMENETKHFIPTLITYN